MTTPMDDPDAAGAPPPCATIVIVTFNSRRFFPRLKASLEAQTLPGPILVLDNASEPDQRPRPDDLPAHAVIVQSEENLGFATGNNRMVALAQTPFVALLNPDAFPAPTWLEELAADAARHPDAAAFGSTQVSADMPDAYDGLGDCYHVFGIPWRGGFGWPLASGARSGECFSPCAAAALYRTDVWRAVGGFDESFFCYCEDVDLGFRLRLAGHRIRQTHRAVVAHVGGGSSGKRSAFAIYHGTRNRLWTYVKNMPGWAFLLFAPAHAGVTLAFLLASQVRGTAAPTVKGLRDGLAGLGRVLQERRAGERARRASVLSVIGAMAWSPVAVLRRAPIVKRAEP